jgi:hypothetical protein
MAKRGMSAYGTVSECFVGIMSFWSGPTLAGMVFFPQAVVTGRVNCRRQRPSWMTSGIDWPTGRPERVNDPSTPVVVLTSGSPAAVTPQTSHEMPAGRA